MISAKSTAIAVSALALTLAFAPLPRPTGSIPGIPIGPILGTPILSDECTAPSEGGPASSLAPTASGTVLDMPEMEIRDRAPVGEDIQSSYLRTTGQNREFRRGFLEFAIPRFGEDFARATLVFAEGPGVTVEGLPPVEHELSWYPGDLKVDVADYDRTTTFLAAFEDNLQDPNSVWSFDVTDAVREMSGGCLGFRAKLVVDPGYAEYGSLGTSIGRYSWIQPHIEFETGA